MNFSEPKQNPKSLKAAIHSLQDWWSSAGVDLDYNLKPTALLAEHSEKKASKPNSEPKLIANEAPQKSGISKQADTESVEFNDSNEDYPEEYEAFQNWLKDPANLIENAWARSFVQPNGCLEPQIMVISSMPEAGGLENASYYATNETLLLKNMLSRIGVDWEKSFRAALSFGRTIDGRLNKNQVKPLVKRAFHLMSLVRPKQVIIFGDTASRAFFDEDLLTARKKKQFINHVSSKTEAIVMFHPRLLLERPELKAEAWKDLQMLTRIAQ